MYATFVGQGNKSNHSVCHNVSTEANNTTRSGVFVCTKRCLKRSPYRWDGHIAEVSRKKLVEKHNRSLEKTFLKTSIIQIIN